MTSSGRLFDLTVRTRLLVAVWAVTLAALLLVPAIAHASAVAQQVQSGTAVNSANGIQTITISSVDTTKSVLFFSTRHNSNRPVGSQLRGRLASSTTIEFERVTDGVAPEPVPITIQWYVVTFGSGVKVQRGAVAMTATSVNVTITAVAAVNQAFVLWSKTATAADGAFSSDDPVIGEVTSTTNLQFRSNVAGGVNHIVAWQVVEFTNAADLNVQKGSTSMTAGVLSATATLSPAVNVTKTFLLVGYNTNGTGADIGARMLRARLTNSTTISFDRSIAGDADDMTEIHWQAVELKDNSTVWGGNASFAAGVSRATATLSPQVNTTRAVAFGSVQSGAGQNMGRSPYPGDDIIGVGSVTASLGIAFRAAASAGAGSGVLTLTINKPTGTVENDVMVASIGFRPNTAVVTAPSGWTLVRRTDNANVNANSLAVYWKVASASEPASYDWTFDTSIGSAGGIQTFSGVDTSTPVDVENGQNTLSGLTHDAPSVTTTQANEMIVTAHTFSSAATWTPPTGMTEAADVASDPLGSGGQSIEMNYVLQSAAGATGIKTATASNDGDVGNAQTLALRPASSVKWLTLDRDNTADTADVGWFVVQFNQGAGFKVGSFTKRSGTGTQTIAHSLGEVPKALILWTDGWGPAETFQTGYWFGFGMTDGTTSKSVATSSQDGVGTSNASSRMANAVLTLVQYGEVLIDEAQLGGGACATSWDDTNFCLNWTTGDAFNFVIHFIAIGGSDVSAKVSEWNMTALAAPVNQSVTGFGFQPNTVIHAYAGHLITGTTPAAGTNVADAAFALGVMDADGDQWAVANFTADARATTDTQRGQQTDGTIYSFNRTLAVQKKASWVSMDADGFTINFTNTTSLAAARVFSLALKGIYIKPGSFNKTTSSAPVSQSIAGVGFQPGAVVLTSFQDVARASPVAHTRFGIGASDGTTQGSSAIADEDNLGTPVSNVDAVDKTSKVFVKVDNSTSTIDAEANLTSLDTDGFTLNWTANDAVATQILYLALARLAVTAVRLTSFGATRYDRGVLVEWRTGYEVDNLGFHVYREVNGARTRVTRSLVAGSGLMAGQGTAMTAERRYAIWDLEASDRSAVYWLEDLDFNGTSTWHGPVTPIDGGLQAPPEVAPSASLRDLGKGPKRRGRLLLAEGARLERPRESTSPGRRTVAATAMETQWALAAQAAVRIGVNRPGWYRIMQPELVAAGLDPHVDPRTLRLFVEGVGQAMTVAGEADGRFDAGDAIEFYGTGVDTPFTDTRVYWLAAGAGAARRMRVHGAAPHGAQATGARSFPFTVQQKERSIYFAALVNGDAENWFGSLVYAEPTDLTFTVPNPDLAAGGAELEVTLQGITSLPDADPDHQVAVLVNGAEVGELRFNAQGNETQTFAVPAVLLREGANTVTLVAHGSEEDYSLLDVVRLRYAHTYRADADLLRFTAEGPGTVTVAGFASPTIRVVDITDPLAPEEARGAVGPDGGLWAVTVRVPGTGSRTLLAFTDATVAAPAFVRPNRPSRWHAAAPAADYVAITHSEFADWVAPLLARRERQGLATARVDVEDLYDEFSFGEKTPQALKDFVRHARATWTRPPRFLLLVGDATIDPRDYAGFGDADFVPTQQVPMAHVAFETASDDAVADLDEDGLPELAVGRLSVRSGPQTERMVAKILAYEDSLAAAWTRNVLLVADEGDSAADFERSSEALRRLVPSGYTVRQIFSAGSGTDAARRELLDAVSEGQLIVNYIGHGSTRVWGTRGTLLTTEDVRETWRNGTRLPLVVAMNCLNGFFYDIYDEESLAETWLRAPEGGAVAAWASSGLTESSAQARANQELFRLLFTQPGLTLGEAVAAAKRAVLDRDVRRSWIFFGDPALRLVGLAPSAQTPTGTTAAQAPTATGGEADPNRNAADEESAAMEQAAAQPVRLADFNADGRDDLLLYEAETGRWSLVLNERTGQRVVEGAWLARAQVFAARLDADRFVDVVLYAPATGEWLQALGDGDGSFRISSGVWASGGQVRVANFAGDARDEVFFYQPVTGDWFEGLSDGKGGFTSRSGRARAGGELSVADFNRDALADLFLADRANSGGWVVVNDGAGGFSAGSEQWLYGWPARATGLGGRSTSRAASKAVDLVLYDARSGLWAERLANATPSAFRSGAWSPGLAIADADFSGDGADDLLLYDPRTGAWSVMTNTPSGLSASQSGAWQPGLRIATGDLDGDGRAEVLLYDVANHAWTRCASGKSGTFTCGDSGAWDQPWTLIGYHR